MKPGDRVRMVRKHGSMNPTLRGHVGEAGWVKAELAPIGSFESEFLVSFDRLDFAYGCWWLKGRYLEVIDEDS